MRLSDINVEAKARQSFQDINNKVGQGLHDKSDRLVVDYLTHHQFCQQRMFVFLQNSYYIIIRSIILPMVLMNCNLIVCQQYKTWPIEFRTNKLGV